MLSVSSVTSQRPIPDIEWQDETNGTTSNLPLEVFYRILAYASLEPKDIAQVSLVCKQWRTVANAPFFWRAIAKSYPDSTLNPDTHPKEQIQALFQKVKETNYPKEILKLFGGINRIAQLPTIQLPSDYQQSDYEDHFKEEYQGKNPIVKFFGSYKRPAFGIRYVHHVDQALSSNILPAGRHKGVLLLFTHHTTRYTKDQSNWTYHDMFRPELYLEASWLMSPECVLWLQKLLSGLPCPKRTTNMCSNVILESPEINADNRPVYQLWNRKDDLSHL